MKYLFGNWKMAIEKTGVQTFLHELRRTKQLKNIVCGIAAPSVYVADIQKEIKHKKWMLGAQNVSYAKSGAFTGEISAEMLKEKQADFCLVGHSERRTLFGEDNKTINQKILQLQAQKIIPMLCIGETLKEYQQKTTKKVLKTQLVECLKGVDANNLIVAYEPVWAIGTGKSASIKDIETSIVFIKQTLAKLFPNKQNFVVLYGGSVKPSNAKEIFSLNCVDGALVGGASLKCAEFLEIAKNM